MGEKQDETQSVNVAVVSGCPGCALVRRIKGLLDKSPEQASVVTAGELREMLLQAQLVDLLLRKFTDLLTTTDELRAINGDLRGQVATQQATINRLTAELAEARKQEGR